ncbi:MAG: AsmA-like C-terminal region-containing protein [bacterium]
MWKLLTFIGSVIRILFWLVLMLVLAGLVFLYLLERDMPTPLVRRLSAEISSDDYLVRIGRATYSLKSGLHLYSVKAFPKRVADSALISADEVTIEVALQPRLPMHERLLGVTLTNLSMPALPPKHPEKQKQADPVIPDLPPFPLTVLNADVLGIKASRLTATIDLADKRIAVTEVAIRWPDKAFAMEVAGHVTFDFTKRLVSGNVKGQAFPENILPLLNVLHSRAAIRQINCFSKIERPVNAEATFDVNIDRRDLALWLDLDVGPCAYRGVPMKYAKGPLVAYDTNNVTTVVIGPLQAESSTGPFAGRLVYRQENESLELDASAAMDQQQLVTIINVLNHGELKPVRCDTPLRVSAKGVIALDSKSTATNALAGHAAFSEGALFNLQVADITSDFSMTGYTARFDNVSATSSSGGKIAGDIEFFFPEYVATSTLFTTHVALSNIDLSDLSHAINVTNTRVGLVSGSLTLSGRTSNRSTSSLSGEGKVLIRDGLIHRMRLFAGLTEYLVRTIPGISAIVNQSSGSMDFVIRNGTLHTENLLVEGDLLSIQGKGSYNIENETLNGVMRVNIFREKTIAGRITHFITLPFIRLLLEFKLAGTFDNPQWSYVNIVERITDGLSDLSNQLTPSAEAPQKNQPADTAQPELAP